MFNNKKIILRLTLTPILCLALICAVAHSLEAQESDTAKVAQTKDSKAVEVNDADERISAEEEDADGFEAVAVYYAQRYQGRRTHSGEIFDHNKLTAAHPSLPHGTMVKIVNTANDRSVVVRINDRCRERSFELIDLTRAAATKLGFYGKKGTAKVRVTVLTEER